MFMVAGYAPGSEEGSQVAYEVRVDGGRVEGPARVVGLLQLHEGRTVQATPVGPAFVVDMEDPRAVLAALYALTDVRQVEGDGIPDVFGRSPGRVQ